MSNDIFSYEDKMPKAPDNAKGTEQQKRHWLDHAAVYAAAAAAFAAAAAAGAGIFQASVARDTEERQLRAYVGITQHGIQNFGEPNQILQTTRKNYGVTPAIDLFMGPIRGEVVQPTAQFAPAFCSPAPAIPNTFALFPSMETPYEIRGNPMSKQQIDLVRDGTQYVFQVWGALFYKDIFGTQRCTRYCWSFKGQDMSEKAGELCLQHNDTH